MITTIEKFMNINPKKREHIINAALEEFALKGYKNASTNEIVKRANISKGLLFHYFNDKKSLFLFLLDYTMNIFKEEFFCRLNYEETDIIKRWGQIALLKIELIQKYPVLYQFLIMSTAEDSVEVKQEIEAKNKGVIEDAYKRVLINIDTSVYKSGLDAKRVSDIIIWVTQGFGNSVIEKVKNDPDYKANYNMSAIVAEFDEYMKLLIGVFYK